MSQDDPFDQGIRRPTPGGQPGPFSGETIIRPRPGGSSAPPDYSGDKTVIRPRPGTQPPPDPFSDRTVVRPRATEPPPPAAPGGQGQGAWGFGTSPPPEPPPVSVPPSRPAAHAAAPVPMPAALDANSFIAAARPLLSLVSRLRSTAHYDDIAGLQQDLVRTIREFENRILQGGIPQEQVRIASYAVCSLLDEAILNTPWGSNSFWGRQTLLVLFHKEAFGGERFFQFLDGLMRQPAQNLELIELLWLCLALGFEGRYRLIPNGGQHLEQVRTEVYQLIRRLRGEADLDLSARWQGVRDVRNPLIRHVPLWVIAAAGGALSLLVYLGFLLGITGASDSVARDLYALAREEAVVAPRTDAGQPPPLAVPKIGKTERFKPLLKDEIARNMVEVPDDRTLRIRNSFAPGSDRLKPEFLPMLDKIANELASGRDSVLVTGHTDDKPIFSARFPSNFELSTARAKHVADMLGISGPVKFEGRADYEPLEPNDSTEHRAINRRVDILIQ